MALHFVLNGKQRTVEGVSPTTTVLDWLRMQARLTGTKEGCAEGDCGACTIAVAHERNGTPQYRPMNSCLMMLPQIDNCAVLTVEGLSAPQARLHPVQQAMVDANGTQCGFCTPGFVMAMFALSQEGEPVDDASIHEALAGNLCRCTGYRAIVDACRHALTHPTQPAVCDGREALQTLTPTDDYRCGAQRFLTPRSFDELFAAMAQYPNAVLLGGGTDLGLRVSKGREAFPEVISTKGVADIRHVTTDATGLVFGGAVTYSELLPQLDAHFPSFAVLVRRIGSRQIRNLGTIAGNLATASPIGDTIPCLIALGAKVTLRSRTGTRTLQVEDFIVGYRKTVLVPGEIIAEIRIPFVLRDEHLKIYKLSKRFDQDISTVIVAFKLLLDGDKVRELRAAYGGMAAFAKRASHLEKALAGRMWLAESLADIDEIIARDFVPISDHRGSAAYRLRAAANLVRRCQIETTSSVLVRVEAL